VSQKTEGAKIELVAQNRRASFDFEIGERFEAGMVLIGSEVKVLRSGQCDLSDAWVEVKHGEAWVHGVSIPVMQGSPFSHEAKRTRKLLLNAREIEKIERATTRDGMTVPVTKLYFKDGYAKCEIALARGKKKADKRESVKQKDAEREARQAMQRGRRGG
jgi:SsrA-binding protein